MTLAKITSDLALVSSILGSNVTSDACKRDSAGILREVIAEIEARHPLPSGVRATAGLNASPRQAQCKSEAGGAQP